MSASSLRSPCRTNRRASPRHSRRHSSSFALAMANSEARRSSGSTRASRSCARETVFGSTRKKAAVRARPSTLAIPTAAASVSIGRTTFVFRSACVFLDIEPYRNLEPPFAARAGGGRFYDHRAFAFCDEPAVEVARNSAADADGRDGQVDADPAHRERPAGAVGSAGRGALSASCRSGRGTAVPPVAL